MAKITISLFEVKEKWQKELLQQRLPAASFSLRFSPHKTSPSNLRQHSDAQALSIFIHCRIDKAALTRLPQLKFITTNSTGFDHIDLAETRQRGIVVSNVPYYGENTVAEHAFALILALSRKIVQSANRTRQGRFNLKGLRGFDLKGKTIGIVGTGHIGEHAVRIATGFEMKILAYDPFPKPELMKRYHVRYVGLEKVLSNADVLTLHAPYNKKTHHLINRGNIRLMKPGSILVNTARGGLVETAALLVALRSGRLAGVGLDVLEEEGIISEDKKLISSYLEREKLSVALQDHQLLAEENAIITPHNAFNSQEAVLRITQTTIENFQAWAKGKPINVVG
ncbi:MAG: hydroxyacid dehydrogenase [Candidatus Doudnabacteria bacterium]|nr:hydroxyacid dehydrogenase [Candidatus Doudnabacteria bacterium]